MTLFGPEPDPAPPPSRAELFDYDTLHRPASNPTTLRRVFDALVADPNVHLNARAISVKCGLRIGAVVDACKVLVRLHQVAPRHTTTGTEYILTSNALRNYREGHREGTKRL